MGLECRSGRMGPSTEACGKTTGRMVKVHSGMLMATSMRGSSRMTNLMATAFTLAQTELSTREYGSMTSSMGRDKPSGQMDQVMWATMSKVSGKVLVPTHGQTRTNIAGSGLITQWRGSGLMSGLMGVNMKATGKTISCMGKVFTPGQTAEDTMESI